MKIFKFLIVIFFTISGFISGQKKYSSIIILDSVKLKQIENVLLDDYGNIYLNNKKDFSFTKYDSSLIEQAKLMFTVPFKVQSVQNPLSIFAFSENAQEVKIFDENLVEIQTINLRQDFGSIKMAYGADLQYLWLLEDSSKTLIKYEFREKKTEGSYRLNLDFNAVEDMIVYRNQIYVLTKNQFLVYNLKNQILFQTAVSHGEKLRRENKDFYIISKNKIERWSEKKNIKTVFEIPEAQNVDKNSGQFLAKVNNKLYLYRIENK